ncbi:MAG TPA: C25 family cysteine peptidase, partial [Bacteroidales bacterium]|nr:C25 family cysteine peptidase [Bacteroidales bacterium]
LSMVPGWFLNGESLQAEIDARGPVPPVPANPDYIIITHTNYLAAAQELAAWKQQLGHKVEIISGSTWSEATVQNAITMRYNAWTPKPDFVLIIGDYPDVPGRVITGSYGTYSTDLYFVCMGGSNDFVADMARGRISVTTATEAGNVVAKILAYEKNPPEDSAFYNKAVHAAYFQHMGNGYAERRFAQTAEEILQYQVNTQGYDIQRIYYTESTVNPTNWNNTLYSAGEPIPSYLLKPGFTWTGNATQINAALNAGAFYIMHRDHGLETGWGDPAYSNTNVSALTNGNKTPIVFTINCLTGKYYYGECFSEKFLRKYPGGAVGVFGHAEVSLSGYNDALAFGLFDAIFASPGCIPNFTGSGGINLTNPGTHPKIFTMGDVLNHGLIRMTQTWGTHQYTNELLHYFGDPAMRIYTRKPFQVTAAHSDTLQCGSDTTLSVFSTNCPSGLATLVSDGEIVAMTQLSGGAAILTFTQLTGSFAVLTISDTNTIPYIDTIIITGGCPKSKFIHQAPVYCLAESVTFTSQSTGTISSYQWNFGAGAVPVTATGIGPHTVNYSTGGQKIITLQVTGTASHTSTATFYMDSVCRFTIPATGTNMVTLCSGELTDDGGNQNYSNSSTSTVTVSPAGASSVNLLFTTFNFENNNDFLRIYNGPNTSSPLIGAYTGTSLPGTNGMLSSTTGSITLQQVTNASNTQAGFKLSFQCAFPNSAPSTNFIVTDSSICTGEYAFTDLSFNGPVTWLWDFGDGNFSTLQNPQHQYQQNGFFDVKLITTNSFGTDSLIKPSLVHVNMPVPPVTIDATRCKQGTLQLTATAGGKINWYTVPSGGSPVFTGSVFQTPVLSQSTTYYVENEIVPTALYGGKTNNSGGGGYLAYEHYLVFNALKPFVLKSVLVYAQTSGSRTIVLRNSLGTALQTKTVTIPAGTSRVTLNFQVPQDNNLRLVATGSPDLYRNNAGLNYPYTIPGLLSIHSSSATSTPTGYYYYFYDWEVQEPSCTSPRVPVQALLSDSIFPVAQFSYVLNTNQAQFTNASQLADSYQWDFGDGQFSTLPDPLHIYQVPATYTARLNAVNQCGTDSMEQQVVILTGMEELGTGTDFTVFPNPAGEQILVRFMLTGNQRVLLRLYDPAGRIIREMDISGVGGVNTLPLDLSGVSQGHYLLHLTGKDFNAVRKIVVTTTK